MRKFLAAAASLVLVAACSGSSSTAGAQPDGGGPDPGSDGGTVSPPPPPPAGDGGSDTGAPGGAIKTVFLILMENHSWSTIKGSASAPYINNTLVPMGAHAEQYFTPPGNHPSEPNYIWLEAGDNLGITNDDDPDKNHKSTTDHLSTQLENANISWKAYVEDIDGTSCPLTSSGLYGAKHVPQLYFDDVTENLKTSSAKCIAHVRKYADLATDLSGGTPARYNFIVPNLCNDMHGQALGTSCQIGLSDLIKKGDDWLKAEVPKILASNAFKDHGVLFVLFDEGDAPLIGDSSDGPIPFIAIGHNVKVNYASNQPYTHSSMLKSLETIFGVPYLRGAQQSNDISDMFTSFP
jgi:hypothetical protein